MKAIFISYDQAYNEEIVELLESFGQRGFTRWEEIQGRGTEDGIPHFGSHAWPSMVNAIISMVPDEKVDGIMEALAKKDKESSELGLRAYSWNIETNL